MRSLYIIPIVHSAADLGRLEAGIEQVKLESMTRSRVETARRQVDRFWEEVWTLIESQVVQLESLMIFQDALPVVPIGQQDLVLQIIRDLAAQGSANHQILLNLSERGAQIQGTESPDLLVQEYHAFRQSLNSKLGKRSNESPSDLEPADDSESELRDRMSQILMDRDKFIAERIAKVLPDEWRGMLFIGMLHDVETWLPEDIQVHYPIGKPKRTLSACSNQVTL